jgi:hypothetical protein
MTMSAHAIVTAVFSFVSRLFRRKKEVAIEIYAQREAGPNSIPREVVFCSPIQSFQIKEI